MRQELADVAAAEQRLLDSVTGMRDEQAREPSRLPGWTRAHVVTHLARNAESNATMVAAALRGERRAQYPGGVDQRARDIDEGARRDAVTLVADLRAAAAEYAEVLESVADDQWEIVVPAGAGPRTIRQRVSSRHLEVEVHHADLDLGYRWLQWNPRFSADQVDEWVARFVTRCPDAPIGRWRVRDDGGRSWLVRTGGYVDVLVEHETSRDDAEELPADGTATGSSAQLLAWLLGRAAAGEAELRIDGERLVAELPEWLPFG